MLKNKNIAVIGASDSSEDGYNLAFETGKMIAQMKGTLLCGGLFGIMEAAAKGAKYLSGTTIGILPGNTKDDANPFIDIPIVTGLNDARNLVLVRSADIVIAIEGGYGTLSEIAIALKLKKPVLGLNTWKDIKGVIQVNNLDDLFIKLEKLSKNL